MGVENNPKQFTAIYQEHALRQCIAVTKRWPDVIEQMGGNSSVNQAFIPLLAFFLEILTNQYHLDTGPSNPSGPTLYPNYWPVGLAFWQGRVTIRRKDLVEGDYMDGIYKAAELDQLAITAQSYRAAVWQLCSANHNIRSIADAHFRPMKPCRFPSVVE